MHARVAYYAGKVWRRLHTTASRAATRATLASRLKRQSRLLPCVLCGAPVDRHVPLAYKERHGLPLRTVMCGDCGMVMFNPMPTEAFLRYFYRTAYQKFHRRTATPNLRIIGLEHQRSDRLVGAVRPHIRRGMRVLDVGCSAGHVLKAVNDAFPDHQLELLGIEPDEQFVNYTNCHVEGVPAVCCMFEEFKTTDKFDLILLMHTFEHILDMGRCLDHARSLLSEDGFIYIETPNMLRAHVATQLERFFLVSKLYTFTPATLRAFMGKAGFRPVVLDSNRDKHMFGLFQIGGGRYPEESMDLSDNCRALREYLSTRFGHTVGDVLEAAVEPSELSNCGTK